MRFEELHDDHDDDEWATALIRAAEAAEDDEWEWRIEMARARVEREEPQIAKLAPRAPAPAPIQESPPSARKGAPKAPPIPPPPQRAETFEPSPVILLRRRSVSTEAPPSAPSARPMALVVAPARAARPPVVIPPKEPRTMPSKEPGTSELSAGAHLASA